MTQETFNKALELNSKIQELNYRIDRKLEEISLFQGQYKDHDKIDFFDFYSGSIEITYKEAVDKMRSRLLLDEQTLEMLEIQFSNL